MPKNQLIMTIVDVIVKPGSKRPGISREGGAIVVRVHERAIDGAATAACIRAIAASYGVAPRDVELVHGARSRRKRFSIRFGGAAKGQA